MFGSDASWNGQIGWRKVQIAWWNSQIWRRHRPNGSFSDVRTTVDHKRVAFESRSYLIRSWTTHTRPRDLETPGPPNLAQGSEEARRGPPGYLRQNHLLAK